MSINSCPTRRQVLSAAAVTAGCALVGGARTAHAEEAPCLNSSDEIDFLYIDYADMSVGDTQNVVVSLKNHAGFEAATLTTADAETGEEASYELSNTVDALMLFSFVPDREGTKTVSSVAFTTGGASYVIDFSDCDPSSCLFTAVATKARSVDEGEPTLQVYSGDGTGDVAEHSSIEEGVDAAVEATPDGAAAPAGASFERDATATPYAAAVARSVGTSAAAAGYDKSSPLVVAIDPGHYGADSGATYGGRTTEATCNWKIASACKAMLDVYDGVKAVLTVQQGQSIPASPGSSAELKWRVQQAVNAGASVMISIHINSGGGSGSEVWVPYNGSYNNDTHVVSAELGRRIVSELARLGLYNRGVKTRQINDDSSYDYADGSNGDYYGIIRYARQQNLPAMIVEHAFIDSSSDYNRFLSSDAKLQSLGMADARGVVNYYGLSLKPGQMLRLFNPNSTEHLYTQSSNEYITLASYGWVPEGPAWVAPTSSSTPVYRLYNPSSGDHHYTLSLNEYNTLARIGWKQEGLAWYSDDAKTVPIYRLFNPNATVGTHHYTQSTNEYETLGRIGWVKEGVAWYGVA